LAVLVRYKIFTLLVFFFLFLSLSVYAGGKREDPIEQAKQLIEEKRYNEAILILSKVMQEEPRRFEQAQALIKKIHRARDIYNEKYQELIELYSQEDVDLDRAYEIFEELEELDKDPNPSMVAAFEEARATAVFLFYKKQFDQLMARAKKLLDEQKYWEAAVTYLEGFSFYLEEFEKKSYSGMVRERIEESRGALERSAREFEVTRSIVRFFMEDLPVLLQDDQVDQLQARFAGFSRIVHTIAEERENAFENARFLKAQNEQIQETAEEEEFHLTYLYLLTFGRNDVDFKEGIIGAIDLFYKTYLESTEEELKAAFENELSDGTGFLIGNQPRNAEAPLSRAYTYALTALETLSLWETRFYVDDNYFLADEERSVISDQLPGFFYAQTRAAGADIYLSLIDEANILNESSDTIPASNSVPELEGTQTALKSVNENLGEISHTWEERTEKLAALHEEYGAELSASLDAGEETASTIESFIQKSVETERSAVERIARLRYEPLFTEYGQHLSETEVAGELLEGYERTIGEEEGETVVEEHDPAGAREKFQEILDNLDDLRSRTLDTVVYLETQEGYIAEGEGVDQQIGRGKELLEKIDALANRLAGLIGEAQEKVLLAQRYREEGYYRLDQARLFLRQNRFEEAREQVKLAGERFDLSLAEQVDPELQEERDARLAALSEEINTAQNNLIVAEVRQLIDAAKNYYAQERYDLAERSLVKAQSRWKVTHVENKEEIEYWLNIVRVALYVRSGREIKETNPLYVEMSQLLNLARENFLKGRELVEQGRREEAMQYFEEAQQNILYVKIPFPLNKEASVLSLRILQYKDPANFDQLFRERFNEAVSKIDSNPRRAYIDLKDLEEIKPNFPGIRDAIYRTELKLGMRVPPPDPEKQRRSDELYRRAFEIVQGNVRAQFPIALEYLNEALKLTPESQKVTNLLDRVEAEFGGRTTTVLSSTAQQQYRIAEEKYIEGNYFEALRIVNQLLKDKNNQNYPPLLELKRRIESKI